ncbi:hypothetical protein [Aquabacterium sp.]|uniref:hypothetical protein n=1 Tax=Aquabacterium sp. TaxID=1872578 RepID=UPI002B73AF68|nr:hypothetical protein [Aquabacterium sp.]HSW06439.1 hypothetical protein [Aquabacterium sp.]
MPSSPTPLILPFAGALSDAGRHALHDLPLPQLERLLARLTPTRRDEGDEFALSPPHERAVAQALGWTAADGMLPFAAQRATEAGLNTGAQAWGLLTPVHLHVGTEQVSMSDPASLQLDEAASRELLAIVRPLFDSEGFALHWRSPLQWLATHATFDGLATASIDRVIGRNIDPWLTEQRAVRLLRRIQNEVQMLMYTHPINDAREAAGLPTVNSFWLSGTGRAQPMPGIVPQVDDRLRGPALNEDWVGWREAWAALDAGPIAALAREAGPVRLVLCGERHAQTFETQPQGLWQRLSGHWRQPAASTLLEAL